MTADAKRSVREEDVDSANGEGRKERLETLYREMLPHVHRFACGRLGPEEGRDVAAETFHAAVVAFADGREDEVTPAWLMVVARNKVIDRWRKAERRSAIRLKFLPRAGDLADFPADWFEQPQREAVVRALGRLRAKDRSLLVLHYLDGISAADLATQLDVTTSAVESRLARARRRFRSFYETEPAATLRRTTDGEEER